MKSSLIFLPRISGAPSAIASFFPPGHGQNIVPHALCSSGGNIPVIVSDDTGVGSNAFGGENRCGARAFSSENEAPLIF